MKFDAAQHWNESHLRHPDREPSNYAKDKEKHFPRNSIVCDFGGSDGVDSIYFIEKEHKVYLFDIANLALKQAERKAESKGIKDNLTTKIVNANKDNIPIKDNFFDVVYSRLSLHYFYQDRIIEVLKDIYRVLKKDGTAYIVVKSHKDKRELNWLKSQSKEVSDGVYNNNGLIQTRFTKKQYQTILKNAGIKNFRVGDYTETFKSQKTYVKSGADKLLYIEIIIKK